MATNLSSATAARIVTARFGQVNALLGMNMLVRGVLNAFHGTLDWIGEILPVPGLESLSHLVNMVLRAATRYMDKVIFSYNLARQDEDQWARRARRHRLLLPECRADPQNLDLDHRARKGFERLPLAAVFGAGPRRSP